jgi:hypothetical protein
VPTDVSSWHSFTVARRGVVRQGTVSHCPCNLLPHFGRPPRPSGSGRVLSRGRRRPRDGTR